MTTPRYPGTDIPVRRGDLVKWFDDERTSTVLFVVSTGDFPPEEDGVSREWFQSEFGEGVMIDTPSAGRVLESEDCANVTLVRPVDGGA